MKDLIHRFYRLFGYSIEIRIESPCFQRDLKILSNLSDDCGRSNDSALRAEFTKRMDAAYQKYGYDPELIRTDTLTSFRCGED